MNVESESLEERRVAALEKMAEAQLKHAMVAEGHLELAKADSADRKTMFAAATEILGSVANYMNSLATQENARTKALEAAWTPKELPSGNDNSEG